MDSPLRRHLPNTLTVLRLVLAGAFFAALNLFRYPDVNVIWGNIAIVLFIAAAITDALDGYLARRWHVESTFGRIMDPFCDKVLILGAFIYLCGPRFAIPDGAIELGGDRPIKLATNVYPWMVVVILARELLVTGIRGLVEGQGVKFTTKWSGKAKMILQSIMVPLVLLLVVNFEPSKNEWANVSCLVMVWVTVVVTVWSGIPYITGLQAIILQQRMATDTKS